MIKLEPGFTYFMHWTGIDWPKNNKQCEWDTDLKIDNLDRVSIPTKIVATFDVEHPILGTTYGV